LLTSWLIKLLLLAIGFFIMSITPALNSAVRFTIIPGAIPITQCDAMGCVFQANPDGSFLPLQVISRCERERVGELEMLASRITFKN
jgi:hypothetical protein